MKAILILGPLCLLVAETASASAAPAWCKGGDEPPSYDLKSLYTETDPHRALLGLVAASCYPEDDLAKHGPQLAKTREAWSKRLGLTEADWADVSEWAHLPRHLRGDPKIDVRDRKAAWSAYSPLDQYGALVAGDLGRIDMAYLADAFGSKLSQLGRLGYVMQCLGTNADHPAATYAMCAPDVAALDAAKLAAEIRGDTSHGAGDRMEVRIAAYETLAKLPAFQADVKTLRAKDPAYETMFALGAAAHAQWAKADPRWIALVTQLDDARATGSRKQSAGCAETSWEAWKSVVAAVPAKTLAKIRPEAGNELGPQLVSQLVSEPNGYLAALSVAQCAQLEQKEDALSRVIGYSLQRWPGFRGPRTATQTAILTADLKLDDRDASIELPNVMREWLGGDGNVGISGVGGIEKIEVEGERATIRFKKEKVTQTRCVKGHETSRIRQIMADGHVVYWYQCDQEITETIEVAPSPPIRVGVRYVAGLKPGMLVRVSDDVPFVAYPKGKVAPAIVTGVEVK